MDGYEVAARLRQNPETAGARLIAVTGYGSDEDRRRTAAAGFERHLTKPLEISELNAVLLEIASEAPRLAPAGRETRSA
jgi:CheY-like chemotaxis protein